MLFDWANQPFQTLVITFTFGPWFVAEAIGDPVRGQALWGWASAIAGAAAALLAPALGSIADRTGARKAWVLAASVPYVIGCLGLWLATPRMADPTVVLLAFGLGFVGSELGVVFTNAMLPDLAPRAEIGRISGSGWALGYLGGLVSLVFVLLFLAPVPGREVTLLGIAPILGLDPALGQPERAVGPLSALWYVVFAIPLFLFTPDRPRTRAAGATRLGLADLIHTVRLARQHRSFLRFSSRRWSTGTRSRRSSPSAASTPPASSVARVPARGLRHRRRGGRHRRHLSRWPSRPALRAAAGNRRFDLGADRRRGLCPSHHAGFRPRLSGARRIAAPRPRVPRGGGPARRGGRVGAGGLAHPARPPRRRAGAPAQAFGLFALSGRATAFLGPSLIAIVTTLTGSQRVGVSPVIGLFLLGLALLYWVKTEDEQPMDLPA